MRFRTTLILALALLPMVAVSGQVENGLAAVGSGDFSAAEQAFQRAAEQGDARGFYHLGAMRHAGMGHEVDHTAAATFYEKAATQGVAEAQMALGALHYKGKGVRKDLHKALELYRQAAENGLLSAQYNLAMMHAAGEAHAKEYGAQQDLPRAYKWFQIVRARLDAPQDLALVDENLGFIKKTMTHGEIREGEAMARQWLVANEIERPAP